MDSIVILLMLQRCKEVFPIRYQKVRDNLLLMRYAKDFEYRNWNTLADLTDDQLRRRRRAGKWTPPPPKELTVDDAAYE